MGHRVVEVLGETQPLGGDRLLLLVNKTLPLGRGPLAPGGDRLPRQHRGRRQPDDRQHVAVPDVVAADGAPDER